MTSIHLSATLSAAQNFTLVAQGQTMTEEYAKIHEEFVRQEFPAVISTLKITTLALGVISLVITVLVHRTAGIVFSCLCIVPVIGIYYIQKRENGFLSRFELVSNQTRAIFNNINIYLDNERVFKEEVLIPLFNAVNDSYAEYKAVRELQNIVSRFDQGLLDFKDMQKNQRYKEHTKIIPCVRFAWEMNTPYTVPEDIWKKFQQTCFRFLHGRKSTVDTVRPYIYLTQKHSEPWSASAFD